METTVTTLPELVADLERRAAEAEAVNATAPVASVYRLIASELRAVADEPAEAAKPIPTPDPSGMERYLTPKEVAAQLHVPAGYP
jgi:hypothetical protein